MFKSALVALFSVVFLLHAPVQAKSSDAEAGKGAKKTVKKTASRPAPKRKTASSAKSSLDNREKLVRKVVTVDGKRKVVYQRAAARPVVPAVPPVLSAGDIAGLNLTQDPLDLKSNVALVIDPADSKVLFEKNSTVALPIASLTKLMTSLVVVEARQDMDELLEITDADIDREKNTYSRLRVGTRMTRADLLHIALMSSENRAASALGRNYPGGLAAFVAAMNAKARALGMHDTHYVEPTGLSSHNVASARDLAKLVVAAHEYPVIRQYSTDTKYMVEIAGHPMQYANSNRLVSNPDWEIDLQKTGYISEAGRCLVMLAKIDGRAIVMVFLDSKGKLSRLADAGRIRKWLSELRAPHMSDARRLNDEG
ncbi:MAG: D-alanyl-D-alanine endopeptidase [Burkholderiaceae bacterium]